MSTLPVTVEQLHPIPYLILNVLSTLLNPLLWSCLVLLWSHQQLYLNMLPVSPRSYKIECACTLPTVVCTVPNPVLLLVGCISQAMIGWFTFAMISLASYHNLPDLISISTQSNPNIRMRKYKNQCTFWMNWFLVAGTPCSIVQPKSMNAFDSIGVIPAETIKEDPLEACLHE